MRSLIGRNEPEPKRPAQDYEKARATVRGMMQSLKDEAEVKYAKPTNTTLDECISEFEAIIKSEADPFTKIQKVGGIVGKLSPHNPHGRQRDKICNLPLWVETGLEWIGAWQEQINPGGEA